MFEKQQDATCYVRKYSQPDLFITITTNPKWPVIFDNLLENQQPHDRPDLIVRGFKQKLNKAMTLMKFGCFGTLQAWLYSIEFQKRGLPYAHTLLWVKKDAKIQPDLIDRVVCAEIPNKEQDKELHSIITTQMINGSCGHLNPTSPFMKDGRSSKKFPMPFQPQTKVGIEQATYREACIAHGLLEQDNAHQMTLQDASVSHQPQSLRSLFAIILVQAQPTNSKELWNEFEFSLCEDFIHQSLSRDQAKNLALIHIEEMIYSMNGKALETFGLPSTDHEASARCGMAIEA
ncbi:hypothetical protein PoB_005674400 [Plakobranchus ocellatus]|uniref:Helitron helicase-like domain-containing protein n=1 Tax=Plakobranchus ocellatus TaxID=259542 RepID=A0AAV4CHH2_9GAST|nr:hypothetical protein PoB_005674400 [Plakobranchus ocellatus]